MRRTTRILALLAFAYTVTPAKAVVQNKADRYWQINLKDGSVQFWRTHTNGDKIEISDACGDTKAFASARADASGGWALSGKYGDLSAELDEQGILQLTLKDEEFATGQRIARPSCIRGTPSKVHMIDVAPKERSFAAVTGDATHLEQAIGVTLPTIRKPPPALPPEVPPAREVLPSGQTFDCQTTPVSLATIRQLQNAPIFGNEPEIWPGALLQGKAFSDGKFTPIKIARGPGTIWLNGVNLDPGESSSAKLPAMTAEAAHKAVAELADQKSQSIESSFDFSTEILYSNGQMAYGLGADDRFLNGLDKDIKIDAAPNKSYVLARFRQTYYTASLEAPPSRYSVFADKMELKDPNNEMGPDNPPLLVNSVAYGRTIFLLVTSPFEGNAVAAALTSANDSKPDAPILSGGKQMTYSQILQGSTFSAFVQGANSEATKTAIDAINASPNKYEAVKKLFEETKSTLVSDWSGGVPVKYTISYLTNRATASMGFAATYNRRDCVVTPKKYASFSLNIFGIDDSLNVTLKGPSGNEIQVYSGSSTPRYFNLDDFIPQDQLDANFELRLLLYNIAGPSNLKFQLRRMQFVPNISYSALNGQTLAMEPLQMMATRELIIPPPPPKPAVDVSAQWGLAGNVIDYRIRLNRGTGEVTVTQH